MTPEKLMEPEQLLERLRREGESETLEVKTAAKQVPEDAYKTVCAFANTSGGWLIFGVRQAGREFLVSGVADPERLESDFLNACRGVDKFTRELDVRSRRVEIDGAQLLLFYVPALDRAHRPVHVRVKKVDECYVRRGSADRRCTQAEVARLFRNALSKPFDGEVCPGAEMSDLDLESVKWFRDILAERNRDKLYSKDPRAFLSEIGVFSRGQLTNAAVLLFGDERMIANLKPSGVADFRLVHDVCREPSLATRWDDREICEGNLLRAFRSLRERIYRLCPQPFAMEPNGLQHRSESPDFLAAREALVNLLIHQDFAEQREHAVISWYKDKVIFQNPGDSTLELEELLEGGRSRSRNPLILRLMRQADFAEEAGRGIPEIVRIWKEAGRPQPAIDNDPARKLFRLTLDWTRNGVSDQSVALPPAEVEDDFLSQVEQICRLRENRDAVIVRVRTPSTPDYLRVSVDEGGIVRTYAVGAGAEGVGEEVLDQFLRVHQRYQQMDSGVISVFVYGGAPAPESLVNRAAAQRVRLQSLIEYQGMIDFRGYVARQTRELAADPVYRPELYVPRRMSFQLGGKEQEGDALELVKGWLADPFGRFVLVLGDAGSGKTFLLHELARRIGEERGPVTPVLIQLRDLERAGNLDQLLIRHFADRELDAIPLKTFRYMLEKGRIALLLDGFEDLATQVPDERAAEHFATILDAARAQAKVVVTSHTRHFESDSQMRIILAERTEQLLGHRIGFLLA